VSSRLGSLVGEGGPTVVEGVRRAVDDRHDHGAIARHRAAAERGQHSTRLRPGDLCAFSRGEWLLRNCVSEPVAE